MTWLVSFGLATGALLLFWGTVAGPDRFARRLTPYVDPGRVSSRRSFGSELAASRERSPAMRITPGLGPLDLLVSVGAGAVALGSVASTNGPAACLLGASVGGACGLVLRTRWAKHRKARVDRAVRADLPDVLDLMSIAMIAGEGLVGALGRCSQHVGGTLGNELQAAFGEIRAGGSTEEALLALASRTNEPAISRFVEGLLIALDNGTPLAPTLQAHARDLHEEERRRLFEEGGRREILMLLPVVFLILPVTIVLVLYPGLVSLEMLVP